MFSETLKMIRYFHFRRIPVFYQRDESIFNKPLCSIRSLQSFSIFGPTGEEVIKDVDLSNKTCLITGANSGIGLEMTRCLSSRDYKVLMACRNIYAAKVVAKDKCEKIHNLKDYEINLTSFQSVKNCSRQILENEKKLDIVILNAGVFGLPWTVTRDSFETICQVNYLSQYMLLMEIEQILAPDARVVLVSAESHRNVNWPPNTQLSPTEEMLSLPEQDYTSIKAYNTSKLCGILFMHYLAYRWKNTGKSVFCAHPGSFVKTKLDRNWWPYETLYTLMLPFSKTIQQAASTPLYCATSPDLVGLTDLYYKDCRRCDESDLAKDLQLAFRIQHLTQDMLRDHLTAEHDKKLDAVVKPYTEHKDTLDEGSLVSNYSG